MSVEGSIRKWFFIMSIQVIVVFNGCVNDLAVRDSSSRDKIRCVLGLSEIITIGGGRDFKAKKITERTQILHLKVLTKKALKILDALHIITSNNHVIYIQQEKGNTMI